jgi:uncharacterized membrane protein HdeD (DUF308 family)
MVNTPSPQDLRAHFVASLADNWKLFLFEGIALVALGVFAILIPQIATLTVEILVAWLLLFSGGIGLVTTFRMRPAPGFWWSLLSAVIAIGAGFVLLTSPATGAVSLTLVLVAFFIIEGVSSILFALDHRPEIPSGALVMIASGVVDLILAAMIFLGLPNSAGWAIGLLLGINLVFGGMALIAMAMQARQLPSSAAKK